MVILLVARWFSVSVPVTAVSNLETVFIFCALILQFFFSNRGGGWGGEGSFLMEGSTC